MNLQPALITSAIWLMRRALGFTQTADMTQLREMVADLVSEDIPGDDKRRQVEAAFFAGLSGFLRYVAHGLITLVAAQAIQKLQGLADD